MDKLVSEFEQNIPMPMFIHSLCISFYPSKSLYWTGFQSYYLGRQWKNLGFIYCPNESFLEKVDPFI
jgi:hypothetical protein